jgi:hypothetical protein
MRVVTRDQIGFLRGPQVRPCAHFRYHKEV